MTTWIDRPPITAVMLNPALIAAIESVAALAYERSGQQPMDWPMAFLIAPLVLHRPTRQALPAHTRTHLSTWVSRNPLLRAGFPERARSLVPVVREGLRFGVRHGLLSLEEGGIRGSLHPTAATGQLRELLGSAALLGRWLTKTNQPSTVFALLDVAP